MTETPFTNHAYFFRMLRESEDRVRELLTKHRQELDLLTEALVEHETLDLKVSFFVRGVGSVIFNWEFVFPYAGGAKSHQRPEAWE